MKATKITGLKMLIGIWALFTLSSSCKNNSNTTPQAGNESGFKQPVVTPLLLSKPQKINWAKVKTVTITPVTAKFDVNNVPAKPYADTTAFKPFQSPVETGKFNYNALPSKNLNINKLPSKPLKFAPAIVNKPQFIIAGVPRPSAKSKGLLNQLGESQGLAGVLVTCVFTDRDGFLWVATDKGVYRYDGQNLVLYVPDPLSRIFSMEEDQSGQIWMGSLDAGLAILDPKTGILKTLSEKEGLSSNKMIKMLIDNQQRVWVSGFKGIDIINTKTQTISTLGTAQGLSSLPAAFITADHNNNIWVDAFGKGLNIIDLKANKLRYLNKAQGLASDTSSTIFCDHQGRIWASSARGIYITVFDIQHGTWQHINELANFQRRSGFSIVESTTQDNDGNIWMATAYNGVIVINPEKRLTKIIIISGRVGDQSDFAISTTHDKNGNTWIGTVNGLFVYKPTPRLLEHIKNYAVSTIAEDDNGLIWEGEFGGVHIVDRKNKLVRTLTTQYGLINDSVQNIIKLNGKMIVCTNNGADIFDQITKTVESFNTKQGLPFRQIQNVLVDRAGNYIISSNRGILVFNIQKGIARLITKDDGLSDDNVTDIMLDNGDKIWSGVQNGAIDVIDVAAGTIRHLDQPGLRSNGTKLFLHNGSGNVWIGTTKGAFVIDQKNNTLTTFSTAQGLTDQAVISILQYGSNVYVGSNGGVSVINPPNGKNKNWKVASYGKDDGLSKMNTGYYLSDNISKDGLYIFGDNGITITDLSPKTDKVPQKAMVTGFNLMDKPMYFAYQPDTSEQKNGGNTEEKITGPYNLPANLELPHDQNNFQFHFTALNPVKLDTSWYRYMLEDADKTWSSRTSDNATGNYFGLRPGTYTFKVEALSHNGIWGPPATFTFTILPPWWQTWWARTLFVLALIALIWGFVYYRSLSLIKEKRLLEEKVNARTKEVMEQKEEIASQRDSIQQALDDLKSTQSQLVQREKMASLGELTAGIAHEIQNPLNFVNNFSEVNQEMIDELEEELKKGNITEALVLMEGIKDNEKKINHHGKRADSIVKGMLQHSRNNSGERQPTDINDLADEYLRLSYHGLRAKDKSFNADWATHFEKDLKKASIIPQDIGRVLLNLYNNAFYAVYEKKKLDIPGFKPKVEVSTSTKGSFVEIRVTDNGTGIPDHIKDKIMQPFFTTKPTGEGTGLGLSLSYDIIVKGHNGTIAIDSVENEYTLFTIQLPLS